MRTLWVVVAFGACTGNRAPRADELAFDATTCIRGTVVEKTLPAASRQLVLYGIDRESCVYRSRTTSSGGVRNDLCRVSIKSGTVLIRVTDAPESLVGTCTQEDRVADVNAPRPSPAPPAPLPGPSLAPLAVPPPAPPAPAASPATHPPPAPPTKPPPYTPKGTDIVFDVKECAAGTTIHRYLGLGSQSITIVGKAGLFCVYTAMSEVEGGYHVDRCKVPRSVGTVVIVTGDTPGKVTGTCQRESSGNVFKDM